MLAGGIVEAGAGCSGAVSAYVAFNPAPGISRLFEVRGDVDAPRVVELTAATTVDLGWFRRELEADLEPRRAAIEAAGGAASIATPKASWVADLVRTHLRESEGVSVE